MAVKVVAFKAFVIDLNDGVYTAKLKEDSKSTLFISQDDVVNSGVIEVDTVNKKRLQCRENGIFTIETSLDSPRPDRIEKLFTKLEDKKVANMSFKTFLDEGGKPGSGSSPQSIEMGLRNEFVP
jgi:hypothetical protein